jgi:hypothetical protein
MISITKQLGIGKKASMRVRILRRRLIYFAIGSMCLCNWVYTHTHTHTHTHTQRERERERERERIHDSSSSCYLLGVYKAAGPNLDTS